LSRLAIDLENFMLRVSVFLAVTLGGGLMAAVATASDFEIHVTVKSEGHEKRTERTEESPSRDRIQPRPVMEIGRNAPIAVSWHAESTGKAETYEDVLVHFFVVEEQRAGQTVVPKLSSGVVYEGALSSDFRPHDKADWQMTFKIPEPGNYLLRVETIGLAPKHPHEHFAAMDLVVK
jgi:hypothetical protein